MNSKHNQTTEALAITVKTYKLTLLLLCTAWIFTGCNPSKKAQSSSETHSANFHRATFDTYYLEGLKQKTLGNDGDARLLFERALVLAPDHPAVLYELAQLLERNRDVDGALIRMEKVIEQEPNNIWYLGYTASLYDRTGQYANAANLYGQLTTMQPNQPEAYYEQASMLLYQNKLADAVVVYDSIEAKFGFNPEVSTQKVKIYQQIKNTEKAKTEIEKLIEFNPDEVAFYGMLAKIYQQEGNTKGAIEVYETLLEKSPDDPYIQLSLYEFYLQTGEVIRAEESLFQAFKNPKLDIDSEIGILINYYRQTETDRSEMPKVYALLDAVVEAHPDDPKGFAMYGDFLYRDKRLEEAREKFYQSIKLDNSRYLVWSQLLFINSELQDVDAMLVDSEEAMELFPNQPVVYLFNGLAHLQKEEFKEAAFSLEQGQGLVVDNPAMQGQFFSNLGDTYYKLEKYQQAWMNYDRALKVNPQNDYVLNNYAYFLSVQEENLDQAQQMSFEVVQRNPTNATYLDTYAWVLFQQGDYTNAVMYLEKALENGGSSSGEILEHLGDAYAKMGNTEQALNYWKQALEKGGASNKIEQKIEQQQYIK